jgi:hypothetical protein
MNHRKTSFKAILLCTLIAIILSACGGGEAQTLALTEASTATEAIIEPTAPPEIPMPTATPEDTEFRELVDEDTLDSYRLTMSVINQDGSGNITDAQLVNSVWVLASQARQITAKDGNDTLFFELIIIGDASWMRGLVAGGDTWVSQPPGTDLSGYMLSNIATSMNEYMAEPGVTVEYINIETVNEVVCRHFRIVRSETDQQENGEMWVAYQSGLPEVLVRLSQTSEYTLEDGSKQFVVVTADFTEINSGIVIEPPQ